MPEIDDLQLPKEESAHCIRVLRNGIGDSILITDGKGRVCQAIITDTNVQSCRYAIVKNLNLTQPHKYKTHLAFAPTKNKERVEWMVEKCTEIGVNAFTPLLCRFSERKELREDRLRGIIISASKQSLNPTFPILHPMCSFKDFVDGCSTGQKYIAHCYDTPKKSFFSEIEQMKDLPGERIVLIGPEGDFSEEEVQYAENRGFISVSLSNRRLRTETAALVAGHLLSLYG